MVTNTDVQVAAALEAVRRPVARCAMPPAANLRTRLATSRRIRALLPTRLMVRRAERQARSLWARDAGQRARARRAMQAIVAGTGRAGELESLARRHLIEQKVTETLFWQPWRSPSLDHDSLTHLRAALGAGRGVLLSSCHSGPYLHGVSAVSSLGRTTYSASSWALCTPEPGSWGRRIVRRRDGARTRDERLVHSVGSFALLRTLLEEGEVLGVFFVMPGSCETRFLGKTVMLASGSARLAVEADALVIPIRTRRVGHRVWVDAAEPLDPREHAGDEDLHAAIAAVHERWILELPANMEDPNREGAWERCAGAEAWLRPTPEPVVG
jgi:lauroyl/myristoyl acyltransferase